MGIARPDPRAVRAAANNAGWCQTVCRAHGIPGLLAGGLWQAAAATPVLPGRRHAGPGPGPWWDVAAAVPARAGASVKDSFADLDLGEYGFDALLEAQWVWREAGADVPVRVTVAPPPKRLHWTAVGSGERLAEWGAASGQRDTFPPELLSDDGVRFLEARADSEVVGGIVGRAALGPAAGVVGVSNVWVGAAGVRSPSVPSRPSISPATRWPAMSGAPSWPRRWRQDSAGRSPAGVGALGRVRYRPGWARRGTERQSTARPTGHPGRKRATLGGRAAYPLAERPRPAPRGLWGRFDQSRCDHRTEWRSLHHHGADHEHPLDHPVDHPHGHPVDEGHDVAALRAGPQAQADTEAEGQASSGRAGGGHPQRDGLRPAGQPGAVVVEGSVPSYRAWSTSKVLVVAAFLDTVVDGDPSRLTSEQRTQITRALTESHMESVIALRDQIPGSPGAAITAVLRSVGDTSTVAPDRSQGSMHWTIRQQVRFMAALHGGRVVSQAASAHILQAMRPIPEHRWGLGTIGAGPFKGGWLRSDTETRQMGIVNGVCRGHHHRRCRAGGGADRRGRRPRPADELPGECPEAASGCAVGPAGLRRCARCALWTTLWHCRPTHL